LFIGVPYYLGNLIFDKNNKNHSFVIILLFKSSGNEAMIFTSELEVMDGSIFLSGF